jgi:hypothetical protein
MTGERQGRRDPDPRQRAEGELRGAGGGQGEEPHEQERLPGVDGGLYFPHRGSMLRHGSFLLDAFSSKSKGSGYIVTVCSVGILGNYLRGNAHTDILV